MEFGISSEKVNRDYKRYMDRTCSRNYIIIINKILKKMFKFNFYLKLKMQLYKYYFLILIIPNHLFTKIINNKNNKYIIIIIIIIIFK